MTRLKRCDAESNVGRRASCRKRIAIWLNWTQLPWWQTQCCAKKPLLWMVALWDNMSSFISEKFRADFSIAWVVFGWTRCVIRCKINISWICGGKTNSWKALCRTKRIHLCSLLSWDAVAWIIRPVTNQSKILLSHHWVRNWVQFLNKQEVLIAPSRLMLVNKMSSKDKCRIFCNIVILSQ